MIPKSLRKRVTFIGVVTLALVLGIGAWVTVQALAAALRSDTNAQNEGVLDELASEILLGADIPTLRLPVGADGTEFVIFDSNGVALNASVLQVSAGAIPLIVFGSEPPAGFEAGVVTDGLTEDQFAELIAEAGLADNVLGQPLTDEQIADFINATGGEVVGSGVTQVIPTGEGFFIDADDWFETQRVVQSPNNGELTLLAISPIGIVDRSINRLAWTLAVIVPVLVLLGGWALWLAIGAALRPVQEISDEANRIAPSNSGDRLPVPGSGDEIADLTVTLNGMLDRLDAGLIRQRQFVSDASHELRSPLSTVRGATELVASSPNLPVALGQNVALIRRGAIRLEAVLDDLTQLADGGLALKKGELDLGDLLLDEVAQVRGLRTAVEIDTSGIVPVVVEAHEVQLSRAIHNLLANAVRHAETKVAVSSSTHQNNVVIHVDDDGNGIPEHEKEQVFERFVRLDDGRDRQSGGAGLGLALVKSIAEAHGGHATCTQSPLGGARFTLQF